MSSLLRFTDTPQAQPAIEAAQARLRHFNEIYKSFDPAQAEQQASRCSQCGVPFCQVHCPLENNIPDWLMLTAQGRLREAYEASRITNTFPEICGRICPQDRLCEGNCVIEADFDSVTIGAVERYLTDHAFAQGWVEPVQTAPDNGRSVGIIGAGPAGLAAAEMLRRWGYAVTIYDRYDRIGGLMMYGIPSFKLEKEIVFRREAWLREAGIQFALNCYIGHDRTMDELRELHDAVLIATGVYQSRSLGMPHLEYPNLIKALDYLTASNRAGLGDTASPGESLHAHGKHVVVIGGGDTAMDCVRTAVRQEAASVSCLYRRDRENMPGSAREVKNAEEEGVKFLWLSAPKGFKGKERIEEIMVEKMRLGAADASGRLQPVPIENSTVAMNADLIIEALGFDGEDLPTLFGCKELAMSNRGTLKINPRMMTSVEGIFAAGDIARGASLVVWAIRDGRDVAREIHAWCEAKAQPILANSTNVERAYVAK